jgi:hypothetical protein
MMTPSPNNQQTSALVENMQIKIPGFFEANAQYLPIGKQTNVNGKSIPAIPEFTQIPKEGTHIALAQNGQLSFQSLPTEGSYVVTIQNGELSFVSAPEEGLYLFNNSLGWSPTQDCDE